MSVFLRLKTDETTTTTTEGNGVKFDCDFDNSDCGWSVANEDPEFTWTRTDHDTCTETHLDCPATEEGHYMYVDGAKGTKLVKAELMNPVGATPTDDCFIFRYNLYVSQLMSMCTTFQRRVHSETRRDLLSKDRDAGLCRRSRPGLAAGQSGGHGAVGDWPGQHHRPGRRHLGGEGSKCQRRLCCC